MAEATATLWQRLWYTRLRDAIRGRFDASLDWRQTLAAAQLPEDIQRVVHDTVRATRLWRGEKVDVTKELIAHFQDGLEGGRPTSVLVSTFGNPGQTAALIRRAKKRGRPVAWQAWHFGWMSFVALVLVYIAAGLWMVMDRPTIKVDYLELIRQQVGAVPVAERAWPEYRDALLAMGVRGTVGNAHSLANSSNFEALPGDEDWPELAQFLRDHGDDVGRLRTASGRSQLGFVPATSWAGFSPEDRELFGKSVTAEDLKAYKSQTIEDHWLIATLIPDLYQLKTSALILDRDARRAILAGEVTTALADIKSLLGISHHCEETPFLVSLLVADAVQNMACDTIQSAFQVNSQLWSEPQLRDLAHTIAAAEIDWKQGFNAETDCFQDMMQRFYTDNGGGDGRLAFRSAYQQNVFELLNSVSGSGTESASSLVSSDGLAILLMPAANMVVASRKETTDVYLSFINTAISKIGLPLDEQQEVPLASEELLSERAGPIGRFRYLFVRLMVPAYQVIWNKIASVSGRRDGVLLGIALELYHREHGEWPNSLEELSPRWLPELPVDRITGKPLRYKIVDDGPVVYSVGVDRDDDGGRAPVDAKQADTELASPNHYEARPVLEAEHDGDWIIWSTAKTEAANSGDSSDESDNLGCLRVWQPRRDTLPAGNLWSSIGSTIAQSCSQATSIFRDYCSCLGNVA